MLALVSLFASAFSFSTNTSAEADDAGAELSRTIIALPAAQTVFELPEKRYILSSTWTIARRGLAVNGAGIGKTIFVRGDAFTGPLIRIAADDVSIRGITLEGNGRVQTENRAPELALNGARNLAESVEVKGFRHIGIAVGGSQSRVTRCVVTGLGDALVPSIGVWHDAGAGSTDSIIEIDHNLITDNGINGIYCTGGKIKIDANQLHGNHRQTEPTGGGQIDIGNAFTTNTDATISNNTIVDGGGMKTGGIEIGGGMFTITKNTIRNHGLPGIGIGSKTKAKIVGNTISNSGRNLARPNRAGIYVLANSSDFEISGNRIFDDQVVKTQTWGVQLLPSTATRHYVIENNDLRGNINSRGLQDSARAPDRVVAGNTPEEANQ